MIKNISDGYNVLTQSQLRNTIGYVESIIENLSDKALLELLGGYDNDIEKLFNELLFQTSMVVNHNHDSINSEKLNYLSSLEASFDEQLKKVSYNYFKTTMLPNFHQGWRNLEWGNMIQLYLYLAILASRSHGKCMDPETLILMFDGSTKPIKDIKVGDKVMGPDNLCRIVLEVHSGKDMMYEVEQKQSMNYTVNSKHNLHIGIWGRKHGGYVDWDPDNSLRKDISAKDYFNSGKFFKTLSFGVKKKGGWELPERDLGIDPYWFGLWLGDGCYKNTEITSIDDEVIEYLYNYAEQQGMYCSSFHFNKRHNKNSCHKTVSYKRGDRPKPNKILGELKRLNVFGNKHIPEDYLLNSTDNRLKLLAGLIDSDGSLPKRKPNTYVFVQNNLELIKQVQQLCWSLGFRANIASNTYKTEFKKEGVGTTHVLHISGDITKIPCKIERKKAIVTRGVKPVDRCGINVVEKGIGDYVGFTCDGDHKYLLADGTITNNSYESCYAFPLWRLYSYDKPAFYLPETIDNRNRKETLMITNTSTLGSEHIGKIVEEIKFNEAFAEKLNPTGKAKLGSTGITTETGSKLHLRGIMGFFRGLHTGSVILDDVPDESSIYSQEQRDKLKDKFFGGITPIVEPGGNLLVTGTPYSERDIYYDLKQDERFVVLEYPAVFPDGKLLSPDRFTFHKLMEERKSLGSLVFSREYLVVPISDDATIFPFDILMRSTIGMEHIGFVDNISSYPIKLTRVVVGCDFAKSANVGADYTVYSVWGLDNMENYYLLHIWRKRGASHNEQISQIISLDQRFKPNKIICESNGFQGILSDMAKQRGLRNIEEFTTTGASKKNLYDGLPSIAAMFERGQIKVPYKDDGSKEKAESVFKEFNGVSFRPDKGTLESVEGHDDQVMSCFFAITDLRVNKSSFRAYSV